MDMDKTFKDLWEERNSNKSGVVNFTEYATKEMLAELRKEFPNKARVNRLRIEINRAVIDHFKNYEL